MLNSKASDTPQSAAHDYAAIAYVNGTFNQFMLLGSSIATLQEAFQRPLSADEIQTVSLNLIQHLFIGMACWTTQIERGELPEFDYTTLPEQIRETNFVELLVKAYVRRVLVSGVITELSNDDIAARVHAIIANIVVNKNEETI